MNINGSEMMVRTLSQYLLPLLVLLLWGVADVAAGAQENATQQYWITTSHFHWIGEQGLAAAAMEVFVNDQPVAASRVDSTVSDGVVHLRIPLGAGENKVSIRQNGRQLFTTLLFYAPTYDSIKVPEELPVWFFHTEEHEAPCRRCHPMTGGEEPGKQKKPHQSFCYPCHKKDFVGLTVAHKIVVEQWQCRRCHSQELAESELLPGVLVRYLTPVGEELADICYQCHTKEKEERAAAEYHHGPVAEGACPLCHDAHGSSRAKMLHQEASQLCISCHEMEDLMELPFIHKIILQKGCIACHDPHAGPYALQLKKAGNALCLDTCHAVIGKQKNNHPINGHPVSGKRDPKQPDRPLSCVSCHSPHASEAENLLPTAETMELCVGCHPM